MKHLDREAFAKGVGAMVIPAAMGSMLIGLELDGPGNWWAGLLAIMALPAILALSGLTGIGITRLRARPKRRRAP